MIKVIKLILKKGFSLRIQDIGLFQEVMIINYMLDCVELMKKN